MPIDPATIDAMVAAGFSAEQMAVVLKAELVAERKATAAADEARKARAREGNRERQARWRDRRNADNADNGVTGRDNRDPSPKDNNQTPTHTIPPVDPNGSTAPKGADGLELGDKVDAGGDQAGRRASEASPRARRIPNDFADSAEAHAVCAEMGLNDAETVAALAEFCDFWMAEGGAKARKVDWPRTLRNRLRELGRRRPSARASPGRSRSSNGFYDLLRDELVGTDEHRSDPSRPQLRIAAGGRF